MSSAIAELKAQREEEIARCRLSFTYWFFTYWTIVGIARGDNGFLDTIQMKPERWTLQLECGDLIQSSRRVIILKARQIGWTTMVAAYVCWKTLFFENRRALVLSKREKPEAVKFITLIKFGYMHLPDWMKEATATITNDHVASIVWSHHSTISSGPSKTDPGRGDTVNLLVMDEFPKFPDPEDAWTAATPNASAGQIVVLGNPDYDGSKFQSEYVAAKEAKTSYVAIFVPWWAAEYRDANWLAAETAGWSDSDRNKEYPGDDITCWAKAGDPVFASTDIDQLRVKNPISMIEMSGGVYSTWMPHDSQGKYLISADVASGQSGDDWDHCVAHVFDIKRRQHVAKWKGQLPPEEYADVLASLGALWNYAELAPEANGRYGKAVIQSLRNRLRYGNILLRAEEWTAGVDRPTQKFGFYTSDASKVIIIPSLMRNILNGNMQMLDPETISQMRKFRYLPDGRMGGKPDDDVMAGAIGVYLVCEVYNDPQKPSEPQPDPLGTLVGQMFSGAAANQHEALAEYNEYFGLATPRSRKKTQWL